MIPLTTSTSITDPLELAEGRLYALGGSYELDGRLTWAPHEPGRHHPLNAYALHEDGHWLVVDPGPMWHEKILVDQLHSLVPPNTPVAVYLSRSEFDVFGTLGTLAEHFGLSRLICGGGSNPFDAFETLAQTDPRDRCALVRMLRMPPGERIPVARDGGDRTLLVLRPPLRMSSVFWAFDDVTGTLFCSDSFTHGTMDSPGGRRVLTAADDVDLRTVFSHLTSKFWWLRYAGANARRIKETVTAMFEEHDISVLAPNHGCIISGKEAVNAHLRLLGEALDRIADGRSID